VFREEKRLSVVVDPKTTNNDRDRISVGIQPSTKFRVTPPAQVWPIGFQRYLRSFPIRIGKYAPQSTASLEGPGL